MFSPGQQLSAANLNSAFAEISRLSRNPYDQDSIVTSTKTYTFGGGRAGTPELAIAVVVMATPLPPGSPLSPAKAEGYLAVFDDATGKWDWETNRVSVQVWNILGNMVFHSSSTCICVYLKDGVYLAVNGGC